jgi:hypothetical protein
LHALDLPLQLLGQPLIIAIQEGDQLAAGRLDPDIARVTNPSVAGEPDEPEAGILEPSHDLRGLIRGAVVHDDALEIREGLVDDARDGAS